MKQLSSKEFRLAYSRETEPVEVIDVRSGGKIIGVWYPAGIESPVESPSASEQPPVDASVSEKPSRMTIRPVKANPRKMVATERRIFDPVEMARAERAAYSRFFGKPQGGKKQGSAGG